jgi:WD40 repeat protein
MKFFPLAGLALVFGLTAPALAAAPVYKLIERIKIADGGFDYLAFDADSGHVDIARTNFSTVIDGKTGAVSELKSAAHGHMVVHVPGTTLGVLPQGAGTILIVDTAKDAAVATLKGGMGPDGATYDPFTKFVFVMNHNGGDATVVDPVAAKVVGTIPIGGTLEFPASNGAGKIFVNRTSVPEIAVIDAKTLTVTDHYKLNGCTHASGLVYIPDGKLLISSCQDRLAKVLQADTGKEVASLPIGLGPDAVFYDPVRKLAFIPCGVDGVLEVISVADPDHVSVVQSVHTRVGSRTGTVDPQTGRVYLIAFQYDTMRAGPVGPRPVPLKDTYEVLVVGP